MNSRTMLYGLVTLTLITVGVLIARQPAADAAPQRQTASTSSTQFGYAQLTIEGNDYTFAIGGEAGVPRTLTLGGLYQTLGGNARPTLINLLDAIGAQGWELTDVSLDRDVYLFQRSRLRR